jgi:hypothetical protein
LSFAPECDDAVGEGQSLHATLLLTHAWLRVLINFVLLIFTTEQDQPPWMVPLAH